MDENKLKISKDTCIVCPTYELAKKLMEIFSKLGLMWDSGCHYNEENTNWENIKQIQFIFHMKDCMEV